MAFIGNTPTQQAFVPAVDVFSGNGSTTAFTLSRTVGTVAQVEAVIENVVQSPSDAYTVSGNTITFTSAPPSGTNNIYVRYTSPITQVMQPSQGSVNYSSMDSNMQAKQGIGFKNRIINGAMVIDQRNAGASITPTDGQFSLDRFGCRLSQASKYSVQQNAGSVTPPIGFTNYLGVTSLSAYTVGSGDNFNIQHRIEGYNFADLGWGTANAKTVTISFLVYSSLTGSFGAAFNNASGNRTYPFSYTISSANTWTQVSVTVAGDTSGTWNTTNGRGLEIDFSLGAGSSYTGTAGSWSTNFYLAPTGSVNVVSTNGATWYMTGVQLEVGTQATTFDYRPISTEIQLCQRYFVRWRNSSTSDGTVWNPQVSPIQSGTTGNIALNPSLPTVMRTTATSITTNLTNANYTSSWTMDSAYVTGNVTKTGTVGVSLTGSASSVTVVLTGATWSPNPNIFYLVNTSAYVDISAEL